MQASMKLCFLAWLHHCAFCNKDSVERVLSTGLILIVRELGRRHQAVKMSVDFLTAVRLLAHHIIYIYLCRLRVLGLSCYHDLHPALERS